MIKKKYKAIVFDWDGTLCNSIDRIVSCIQHAADINGLEEPPAQKAKNVIGLSLDRAMKQLFPASEEKVIMSTVDAYRQLYLAEPITENDLFEGVYDLLDRLDSAGYFLAVATGKSRRGLNAAIRGSGVEHFFNASCCADEAESKPAPDMLFKVLGKSSTCLDSALMIGDSTLDLAMAANAGVDSIAVSSGAHSNDDFEAYNPLLKLRNVTELSGYLL